MSTPSHILHYTWSARFGGIERLVLDLAVAQREAGLDVTVAFGRFEGEFREAFAEAGLRIVDLGLKGGFDMRRSIRRRVHEALSTCEIVHLHSYTPVVAGAVGRVPGRVVYTEHGNFGFGRPVTISDRVKTMGLGRFLRSRSDGVTFNSAFTESVARERYGLPQGKGTVIHNGIRLDERLRQAFAPPDPGRIFTVGTSSRLAGFKRVDRLIDAYAQFRAEYEGDSRLLIVGDGPLRRQLVAQAAELGVGDAVTFAGFQEDVLAFQQAMDVCVYPSEHEPFGLAAVETLALGKPTICWSDGGGLMEIIRPVCQEDVVSDAATLSTRLLAYSRHDHVGPERRRDRARHFGTDRMAAQIMTLYREVMGCVE